MQNSGVKFYTLEDYFQGITAKEIKKIVEEKGKKIVIIENYYNHMEVIKKFSVYDLKNVQFIFSARTVLYDTRLPEVCEILNIEEKNSSIFDINKLDDDEIYQMSKILTINGLWGTKSNYTEGEKKKLLKVQQHGNKELQGILLEVIESSDMKSKIEDIVKNIKKMSNKYYETLILALLIKVMSLNISTNDMSRILHFNFAVDTLFTKDYNIREILDFTSGEAEYRLKSAVTANTILQELDCNEQIIQNLFKVATYANKYRKIEKYENALKNIISYSHVKTFLSKNNQEETFLIKYYDSLKEVDYYKENSFFWLQYSIACANINKYSLAQTYLDNAYSFFRESEKIVPFQLDTQQARLNLLMIKNNFIKDNNEIKEKFRQAHNLLMKPVISNKDNPVKQMYVFDLYLDKGIKNRILNAESDKEYAISCSDAYNKVKAYIKSLHDKYDKKRLEKMAEGLLKNSIYKNR